jgi:WD40 repeat protein
LYALDGIDEIGDDLLYTGEQEETLLEPIPVLSSSPLPDFPLRWNDNDSLLKEESEEESESWLETTSDLATETVDPSILDPPDDLDDLNLLEQLQSLSLGIDPTMAAQNAEFSNNEEEEDKLPPYMYCQPCDDNLPEATELDWIDEPAEEEYSFQPRQEAVEAAEHFIKAMSPMKKNTPKNERSCLGHKERILGLDLSECGKFLATASEDSTVRIWDTKSNRLLATMDHNKKFECLRVIWAPQSWRQEERCLDDPLQYLLATGSADGVVCLYSCSDPLTKPWLLQSKIDHSQLSHFTATEDPDDKPQVYSLQFIDDWKGLGSTGEQNSFLLTSSDDHVHLWEWDMLKKVKLESGTSETRVDFREVISIKFSNLHGHGYGVRVGQVSSSGMFSLPPTVVPEEARNLTNDMMPAEGTFGGDRNPNGLTFVFDAQYNATNGFLGVALSDGSLRILNGRGICLSVLQLPGMNSHLTSFAWDRSGRRLATCVASGHIITWSLEFHDSDVRATCVAIFERGHEVGRPLFGARYIENHQHTEDILLSWGVDGRLCLWDACAEGEAHGPLAILLAKESYPIYCVGLRPGLMAVGGGDGQNDFIGVPVYLYDFEPKSPSTESTATLTGP